MRLLFILIVVFILSNTTFAFQKDSSQHFTFHDSSRTTNFMSQIHVLTLNKTNEFKAGIIADYISLFLESVKSGKEIVLKYPKTAALVATGLDVSAHEKGKLTWKYNWELNQDYKLLISIASDSAGHYMLYSGYVFLQKENKWKFLGTCKTDGFWRSIMYAESIFTSDKKQPANVQLKEAWGFQRNSWKQLTGKPSSAPEINLNTHVDSARQYQNEIRYIKDQIATGKTDVRENFNGVYYKILNEGNGRQVQVTDTVTVYYKGYLFSDESIFDQTKAGFPATFPLNRLIQGWQIAVPQCRVGGKIKIVIPSALAYSIRTRSSKIPPNSILVFEVEILEAIPQK